jgi:hypothetical protein
MAVIVRPALCSPRTADSRPAPGPFKFTSTSRIPTEEATLAASWAATVAAKADDLRDPEKLTFPADDQEITLPAGSVMAIIVLLKVAFTCATPDGTEFAARFFALTAVVVFLLAGCLLKARNSSLIFSY